MTTRDILAAYNNEQRNAQDNYLTQAAKSLFNVAPVIANPQVGGSSTEKAIAAALLGLVGGGLQSAGRREVDSRMQNSPLISRARELHQQEREEQQQDRLAQQEIAQQNAKYTYELGEEDRAAALGLQRQRLAAANRQASATESLGQAQKMAGFLKERRGLPGVKAYYETLTNINKARDLINNYDPESVDAGLAAQAAEKALARAISNEAVNEADVQRMLAGMGVMGQVKNWRDYLLNDGARDPRFMEAVGSVLNNIGTSLHSGAEESSAGYTSEIAAIAPQIARILASTPIAPYKPIEYSAPEQGESQSAEDYNALSDAPKTPRVVGRSPDGKLYYAMD